MGIEKKVLSIRLDEAFIEEIKETAREENRSVSNFVETVLKKYLNEKLHLKK